MFKLLLATQESNENSLGKLNEALSFPVDFPDFTLSLLPHFPPIIVALFLRWMENQKSSQQILSHNRSVHKTRVHCSSKDNLRFIMPLLVRHRLLHKQKTTSSRSRSSIRRRNRNLIIQNVMSGGRLGLFARIINQIGLENFVTSGFFALLGESFARISLTKREQAPCRSKKQSESAIQLKSQKYARSRLKESENLWAIFAKAFLFYSKNFNCWLINIEAFDMVWPFAFRWRFCSSART